MQGWTYLMAAILLEVAGTISMKLSDGLTKTVPSILLFVFYGLCFASLSLALKKIDLSIAYAVWCGLGIAIIAAIGTFCFEESMTIMKMISLVLIILGVVGLNLSDACRG